MSFSRALGLVLSASLFFFTCKKPALEDTALIPDNNFNLEFTDTLTLRAYSVREESVDVTSATLCVLGFMDDPDFGKTTAGFYLPFMLVPGTDSAVFDDGPVVLDSVILYLRYFGTYGDWSKTYPQAVTVYEMSEGIIDSLTYYSNQAFDLYPVPVGQINDFYPSTKDSVTVNGSKWPPVFRIKLNRDFGEKFTTASPSNFYSTETLREFFKGLYVTGSKLNGGRGMVLLNPNSAYSKLTFYYHDMRDTAKTLDFRAHPTSFVNRYEHDYTGATVKPYIDNPGTSSGDDLIFIQGLAGINAKITVPYIRNLGDIIINRAELVLTQVVTTYDDTAYFKAPSVLTVLKSDSDGKIIGSVTPDQIFPASIFGGSKKNESDSAGTYIRYRLSLSQYYQEVLKSSGDLGIFILPSDLTASNVQASDSLLPGKRRAQLPNRIIAGGGSHPQYALKLNLTYTVIQP